MSIVVDDAAHVGAPAYAVVLPTHAAQEISGAFFVRVGIHRRIAEVDATRNARPRVGARKVTSRDLDELLRTPARNHAVNFGAAPGERSEHSPIRARERRYGACDVRTLNRE